MQKLTDSRCRNIKPTDKTQKLFDGGGLFLKVKPNGVKTWHLKYRFASKEKLLSFGKYPIISLADARQKQAEAKKMLADNIDPSEIKKLNKNELLIKQDNTFEKVAREWHLKQKNDISLNYWKEKIHRLERDIFPQIGNMPIDKINSPILLKVIQNIEERGAREMAKRALQMCHAIFNHAIATSRTSNNPTNAIKPALLPKKTKHYPCIHIEDMPELVKDIYTNKGRLYPRVNHQLN